MSELDDGVQGNESIPTGLLESVAAANHKLYSENGTPDKNKQDPAQNADVKGAQGGVTKLPKKTNTETEEDDDEEDAGGDNAEGLDTQDFSRTPAEQKADTETETSDEHSKENTETETEAEKPSDYDWISELPTAPEEVEITPPTPDEFGQIDPVAYADYIEARMEQKSKIDNHNTAVITKAFEAVEKILPEVKENPGLQKIIRSTFLANNNPVEIVDIARELRTTFDGNVQKGKTAGIASAKTSIEIQKNAAVETKSPTKRKAERPAKDVSLDRRLARNDVSAFEELMGQWQSDNKV